MKEFYFIFSDDDTGETFVVNTRGIRSKDALLVAMDVASDYFNEPHYDHEVDEEEVDWLGYDVY